MSQPKNLSPSKQLGALLESTSGWPAIFNRSKPKPLAMKMKRQIKQALPQAPLKVIGAFLHYWTRRPEYLKALAAKGSIRFNLDGSPASRVSEPHRAFAAEKLAATTTTRRSE